MDEATCNLDNKNIQKINRELNNENITRVLVTHQEDAVIGCHDVVGIVDVKMTDIINNKLESLS
jgi:ABC-type bacteriocin/lantibiotic exporter with double-glycine peptidase domain